MEDEVIKKHYKSDAPEKGYQCPECGKYFNDEYFSKPLEDDNSLCCPHCSNWMEIIDAKNKVISHYENVGNIKKVEIASSSEGASY